MKPNARRLCIYCQSHIVRLQFSSISAPTVHSRSISSTKPISQDLHSDNTVSQSPPDVSELPTTQVAENAAKSVGITPLGSRRRRAALQSSKNIPFEQLPYQCFQEARKFLQEDRKEKLVQIEEQRAHIERLKATDDATAGGWLRKRNRILSHQNHLHDLKIKADINDPMVKKRFEDGEGDMNRPIYRFLADRKWRSRKRPIIMQRITQMHVVPDVLPKIDPIVDVSMSFGRLNVQPGEFVPSNISETHMPRLAVQPFERGEKLVSIAVVDSDVPNLENDGFDYRCHFLAANIPISPTSTGISFNRLSLESQIIQPWLPPYAQKGAPYHRLSVWILDQPDHKKVDIEWAKQKDPERLGFVLGKFMNRHLLKPIGVNMFRTQWDATMDGVMARLGVPGADVEYKFKRVEPLPLRKKPSDSERYR